MSAHEGGLDASRVRRALLRALVLSVVALPAGLLGGSRALFSVLALSFATVPMSLAELALPDRRRAAVLWDAVALVGAFLLVSAAAFEAAYAQGLYQERSVVGAFYELDDFTRTIVGEHGEIGVALRFVFAAGIAVSLWAPFAARGYAEGYDDPGLIGVLSLLYTAAGAVSVALSFGVLCVLFHELPVLFAFVHATTNAVLGALPGGLLIPVGYGAADALERRLFHR